MIHGTSAVGARCWQRSQIVFDQTEPRRQPTSQRAIAAAPRPAPEGPTSAATAHCLAEAIHRAPARGAPPRAGRVNRCDRHHGPQSRGGTPDFAPHPRLAPSGPAIGRQALSRDDDWLRHPAGARGGIARPTLGSGCSDRCVVELATRSIVCCCTERRASPLLISVRTFKRVVTLASRWSGRTRLRRVMSSVQARSTPSTAAGSAVLNTFILIMATLH